MKLLVELSRARSGDERCDFLEQVSRDTLFAKTVVQLRVDFLKTKKTLQLYFRQQILVYCKSTNPDALQLSFKLCSAPSIVCFL